MTLSGVNNTVRDGSLGAVPSSVENVMVVFGACSAGTDDTIYSYSDKDTMLAAQGYGPLVQAAAYLLGTGPIYMVPVNKDVAGVAGSITKSGAGPTITVAGAPYDAYEVVVTITKAGALGVGEFSITLDGGDTGTDVIIQIPAGGTYAIPNTNLTLTFPAGSYVLAETYSFDCTAPGFTTTELNDAIDAFLLGPYKASLALVVGTPASAAATAALATAVQSKLSSAETTSKRYIRTFIEGADDTDSNLLSATINVDAKRVVCCPGFVELYSDVDGRYYKRSAAWVAARRALATKANVHIGRTIDGTLLGINSLVRDERKTPGLATDTGRMCVLRTYVENSGYFIEDDYTLAAQGSDFSQLRNGRVLDKALYLTDAALWRFLHSDFDLAPDGSLAEHEAKAIEQYVTQALDDGLIASKNASAVQFTVNRTYTARTLRCKTRIQIRPDAKWIEHDIGFTRTIDS